MNVPDRYKKVIGISFAILVGILIPVLIPEIRLFLGLEKSEKIHIPPTSSAKPLDNTSQASIPSTSSVNHIVINEHSPQYFTNTKTNFSITFKNLDGEEIASLNIAPKGLPSSTHAIVGGETIDFYSSAGGFTLQVLNVDYLNKTISIQISKNLMTN